MKSELAQGANIGDRAYGVDGNYYYWNGDRWEQRNQEVTGTTGGSEQKTAPPFSFDWEAARKAAFDPEHPENSVLGKYYLQKLKDAGDDVERAKRLLQEDYDRGSRIATEDYARGERIATEDYQRTERIAGEELASQLAQFGLESADERRETIGAANRRGVLVGQIPQGESGAKAPYSDYAREYLLSPMEQRQALRKQAIERAIQRQREVAGIEKQRQIESGGIEKQRKVEQEGITRTRGLEEQNIQFPRTQQQLQEQTRREAYTQTVPLQYQESYQKYRVAQGLPER